MSKSSNDNQKPTEENKSKEEQTKWAKEVVAFIKGTIPGADKTGGAK